MDELNVFASDLHRRVVGNLDIPRSAEALVLTFEKHDPVAIGSNSDEYSRKDANKLVREVLLDLEAEGLVANLGEVTSAEDALAAMNGDSDTLDIGKSQGKAFVDAVESTRANRRHLHVNGTLYGATVKAWNKLNAPIPEEPPPLTGDSLREAEEFNKKWHEENEARAKGGSK